MTKKRSVDTRVYADLAALISLQNEARGFSLLPRQPVHSPLYGRYASRLRGRGLNLEELRPYSPGDDIRLMAWKATIRTGKPHVRSYTEERDRPALILVDQRISMFFGSRRKMKSVVAAELAALTAWRVISSEDRVGAIIFNDENIVEVRPRRNPSSVLRLLRTLVDFNGRLKVGGGRRQNDAQLNKALLRAEQLCTHDFLVILVTDLSGWDRTSAKRVKRLARHNDVFALHIFDPLERRLPPEGRYVVSDGELQIEFDAQEYRVQKKFTDHFSNRVDGLTAELKRHNVPVIPVDTVTPAHEQVRAAIGEGTRAR